MYMAYAIAVNAAAVAGLFIIKSKMMYNGLSAYESAVRFHSCTVGTFRRS